MMLDRIAVAGLFLIVSACTAVREVQPAQFIPQHGPALVWVTTTSSALVAVASPRIDGDTLRGMWAGSPILVGNLGLVAGGTIWSMIQKNSGPGGTGCTDSMTEEC